MMTSEKFAARVRGAAAPARPAPQLPQVGNADFLEALLHGRGLASLPTREVTTESRRFAQQVRGERPIRGTRRHKRRRTIEATRGRAWRAPSARDIVERLRGKRAVPSAREICERLGK